MREWEAAGELTEPEAEPITIEQAWEQYLADAVARNLKPANARQIQVLRCRMEQFGRHSGLRFLREFDLTTCRSFRATWPLRNLAALKTLDRLRTFFRFAAEGPDTLLARILRLL